MSQRRLHLNLFLNVYGHHPAAWRVEPAASRAGLTTADYYLEYARLAEQAAFDAVFFADGQGLIIDEARHPIWVLEPLTLLSALAATTERIGLIATVSSSFANPFTAARQLASIDVISGGRVGVNVVTSMGDHEAQNHGIEQLPAHPERYARAREFIEVLRALWGSIADNVLDERDDGVTKFFRDTVTRRIDHRGEHFRVAGPLNVPRSPQGEPVIFQAGGSEYGRDLAARYGEGVYEVAADLEAASAYAQDVRGRARSYGRASGTPVLLPGLITYIGSTREEAVRRRRELNDLIPLPNQLEKFRGYFHTPLDELDLDDTVPPTVDPASYTGPRGRFHTVRTIIENGGRRLTIRELLDHTASGGGHLNFVGTPENIADEIERWFRSGAVDGFNLMPPQHSIDLPLFVEEVVPILRERGVFRYEYRGRTLRDHLNLEVPRSFHAA